MGGLSDADSWYIPFFLFKDKLRALLIIAVITGGINFVYVLAILNVSCFLVILYWPPYHRKLDNACIFIWEIVSLIVSFYVVMSYISPFRPGNELSIIFAIQGGLIIGIALSFFRIFFLLLSHHQKEVFVSD